MLGVVLVRVTNARRMAVLAVDVDDEPLLGVRRDTPPLELHE